MNDGSIVVARPQPARELVLLFHGVGSTASNLVPLAQLIARQQPQAMVVSVHAPHPSSSGAGRQWFSVAGITEANRPERIAAALPEFEGVVRKWQAEAGADPEGTTLVGFSQGAIMSLESTQVADLAHRVVAIAGRFAQPLRRAPAGVTFRFVHGENDPVIDPRFSLEGAETLRSLGADAVAQLVPGLGHGIDERAARLVLQDLL
jgi:phospholipase/carboxylesterase